MLRELAVHNLALIEDVRVELKPGFCAWTGETGAGKTLLLEALGLLLGERVSVELLRAGAEELRVVGTFDIPPALRGQVEAILKATCVDDQLLILRRLTSAGRSSAYINDQPVTTNTLKQIGALLVDIHGQRESHSLLEPAHQLELLDAFGGLAKLRQEYLDQAERVRELRRQLRHLETTRQNRVRELNMIRFEKEELDQASLVAGELEDLARRRERLAHAQAMQEFAQLASGQLYDNEGSVFEVVGKLQRDADHWAGIDPNLASIAQRLQGLAAEAQDLAQSLRPLDWNADPGRREEIEDRIQLLRRLETKYAKSLADLIVYRGTLDEQEKALAGQEEDRSTLEQKLHTDFAELKRIGARLSAGRAKVAKKFAAEVAGQLVELGMAEASFTTAFDKITLGDDPLQAEIPLDGLERLELMLAANRGEPARPLRKVASGGEMSRIMLALKTVLAAQDQVGTLIFDEIDANVGGRLGDVLGSKLAALGKTHQVICVTHLPQVASYARHQWTIRKNRNAKRTTTTIDYLSEAERLEELASMLRGNARGETTRQEVAAMLAAAKKRWA